MKLSQAEVKRAIYKMKNHKTCGPDVIPAELWKMAKAEAEAWLAELFISIMKTGEIPGAWRKSVLVPFHKKKDMCGDYRNFPGIKLISQYP